MNFNCARCGKKVERPAGHVNRSRAIGAPLYCGRKCSGIARRKHKTKAQRVAEKAAYDKEYLRKNIALIKAKKRAHHLRTYDPATARIERKKRAKQHAEYCRRPDYRRWKSDYDRKRRDGLYGEFAEAARLTIDLNKEIKERSTNHEIRWQNQTSNKSQFRRRKTAEESQRGRPRGRDRRDRHQAPLS